jgi:hypothetical protein
MAIKELDPGQRHTFAEPTPLRVELQAAAGGVELQPLDQAGGRSAHITLTPTSLILTPQPRRVRLVAVPVGASTFEPGTSVRLSVRTEGPTAVPEDVQVTPVDLGALGQHELAVIEFAENRIVLTVSPAAGPPPPPPPDAGTLDAVDPEMSPAPVPARIVGSPAPPDDEEHAWLKPGRYALRSARHLDQGGRVSDAPGGWGLVLDASPSMRLLQESGQLTDLIAIVSGINVEWTGRMPAALAVASGRAEEVPVASWHPAQLEAAAYDELAPSSWAATGAAAELVCARLGGTGSVVVVTDGVPGDIERLTGVARSHPSTWFSVVVPAVSREHAVDGAHNLAWWQDELAGLADFAALTNTKVVAVDAAGHRPEVDQERAARVALRLTESLRVAT